MINLVLCIPFYLVSGHGVDGGDSGSGLCFLHSKLYFLTGVVSLKELYANHSIALFTSVNYHIECIRRLYNYYKEVRYNWGNVMKIIYSNCNCNIYLFFV